MISDEMDKSEEMSKLRLLNKLTDDFLKSWKFIQKLDNIARHSDDGEMQGHAYKLGQWLRIQQKTAEACKDLLSGYKELFDCRFEVVANSAIRQYARILKRTSST